jgi:hypothetical protein
MKESSNYEAAVEIREKLHQLPELLVEVVKESGVLLQTWPGRRAQFACAIFAQMIGPSLKHSAIDSAFIGQAEEAARRAWLLADALHRAEPPQDAMDELDKLG